MALKQSEFGIMSRIRQLFSIISSALAVIVAPVWSNTARLRFASNMMTVLAGAVFILWILIWVSKKPVFAITHVTIESVDERPLRHVNLPTIKALAAEKFLGNFFDIRLDYARQAVESMPWVRKASVRRVWPNRLVVAIEEHQPLGIWNPQEGTRLMNTFGEVFVANMAEAEAGTSLLKFSGPEGSSQEVFKKVSLINQWFAPWGVTVSNLELSSRYAWKAKLSNGMSVELGRELDERDSQQIVLNVERLFKTWSRLDEKLVARVDSIDLRYANGYAIHLGKKL
jgi:cell division protein FtsQ